MSTGTWPTSTPRPAEPGTGTTGGSGVAAGHEVAAELESARPVPGPPLISFLSDFGTSDEFVGVVHAVLARHAPAARVIDLTHHIPAHDVRAGALTLWRAAPWVTPGVILAVVDPGVGTARRAVAVRTERAVLVGPDNGLLLPATLRLGGATEVVELAGNPDAPGATFAGRDVFAPAAARAALTTPFGQIGGLGTPVDPAGLAGEAVPAPVSEDGGLRAEVLWVDHFGNAQINATPSELQAAGLDGGPVRLELESITLAVEVVRAYGDIGGPGRVALVVDSYGMLSICADGHPVATELGLRPGSPVRLRREQLHPR